MSDRSDLVAEFARACKAAARAVSLYPGTHPTIRAALSRVTSAAGRLTPEREVTISVLPDTMSIADAPQPARPDAAIGELAALLHGRLVGELTVDQGVTADDWRELLLILARTPEELVADGGVARVWGATGRRGFTIREIDYAEVLRERSAQGLSPTDVDWDRIISCCLQGDRTGIDERALGLIFEIPGDASRLAALLDRFEHRDTTGSVSMGARAAALLHLLRAAAEAAERQGKPRDQVLQTIADATARLSPEMVLSLLAQRESGDSADATLATDVLDRMSEGTIASFVANSVVAERAATERLAWAFQALVPDVDRRDPLLAIAHDEAAATGLGEDAGFEQLWQTAADMLTSYTDEKYVSAAYAKELSGAREQAIEVDRVADDPPERVQAWLTTIAPDAITRLDLDLLLDLTQVEERATEWSTITPLVVDEIERRTVVGDLAAAHALASALVRETGDGGRPELASLAEGALDRLATGPLVRHLVRHLRKGDDADSPGITSLCQLIGPRLARPLAEALAAEQQPRTMRHLRDLLLGFGAAGRQSVEQLKNSTNPAVRRTAIDLLRVFGGIEALPELTSMLDDADPHVQRESIRAIVQIGTREAHAVLQRALVAGGAARETLVQQLIGLRDERAAALLCYVLDHTQPRGALVHVHLEIIDALGGLGDQPESIRALREARPRGDWWAPRRTAALRSAAAGALHRINSPAASGALDEAAARGGRGVRAAIVSVRGRAGL
jgi:hypothetical protein